MPPFSAVSTLFALATDPTRCHVSHMQSLLVNNLFKMLKLHANAAFGLCWNCLRFAVCNLFALATDTTRRRIARFHEAKQAACLPACRA